MLDPRIYRTGLVAVALAVVIVAFSLGDQQGPATTSIPPEAFNGQNAYLNMVGLARDYPDRRPGSAQDDQLAGRLATALRRDGFLVSTPPPQTAGTAGGARALQNVIASRTGLESGSIVILAHRDALGSPAMAELSGTAVLLELARVLAGETQHRSLVLASTSGSAGAAGATQLARRLGGQVDAVIVLGDLAGARVSEPVVVPWSGGGGLAPPMLRNTVAAALAAQAGLRPGGTSLGGQLARLAFPLTTSEQGPFGARGEPAVQLSLSGERPPAADEPVVNADRITALGRAVLQTVDALDAGPNVPPPSAYLLVNGMTVPAWAVRLLVLALILPVLMTTVDGLARARRRGHPVARWILWVAVAAGPFALALLLVRGAALAGLLSAPPGPVRGGVVAAGAGGIAVLVLAALAIVLPFLGWRRIASALAGGAPLGSPANPGAGAAVLLVSCAIALLIWVRNPFAALLLIPALHLWTWLLDPDRPLARPLRALLLLAGAAPVLLAGAYDASQLGLRPLEVPWEAALLIADGQIGILTGLLWSVVLGCSASIVAISLCMPRIHRHREQPAPVTVRGPAGYAGPGSLGGTESALRR